MTDMPKIAERPVRDSVVMTLGRGWVRHAYDWTMVGLALVVIWLLTQPNEGWVIVANISIWVAFGADYFTRFALSTDRRLFLRRNIPDLIAIMPLDFLRVARLARLARLVRLVRAGSVLWRVSRDVRGIFATNGLGYVIGVAIAAIAIASVIVWRLEEFVHFPDALWWAVVTATTVGYGDIAPEHGVARIVAVVLMLVGIGTLGMITGSIATYFVRGDSRADPDIEHIRQRLADWVELSPEERRKVAAMLDAIANSSDDV